MRKAMVEDFKIGAVIVNQFGPWTIIRKYDNKGIWEIRNNRGMRLVFADEAKFYQIKEN